MGRYFGTDGFRGEANINLTADHAYQVGRFLGWYYNEKRAHAAEEGRPVKEGPARIVIGKDTRRSSYMFEYSLVAGLVASGAGRLYAPCHHHALRGLYRPGGRFRLRHHDLRQPQPLF